MEKTAHMMRISWPLSRSTRLGSKAMNPLDKFAPEEFAPEEFTPEAIATKKWCVYGSAGNVPTPTHVADEVSEMATRVGATRLYVTGCLES